MDHLKQKTGHVPGQDTKADVLTKPVRGVQMRQAMMKVNYLSLSLRSRRGQPSAIQCRVQRRSPDPTDWKSPCAEFFSWQRRSSFRLRLMNSSFKEGGRRAWPTHTLF